MAGGLVSYTPQSHPPSKKILDPPMKTSILSFPITSTSVGLRRIAISTSACLFVCMSLRLGISETTFHALPIFQYAFTAVVARSSYDDTAIRYVLPVLCMTSYLHIMAMLKVTG